MADSLFAGTWVFDRDKSRLVSPPMEWTQYVTVEEERISVREEIKGATANSTIRVNAAPDGAFYPVTGSPVVDEISYKADGALITGIGRKNGLESLREHLDFSDPGHMTMIITLLMNGKEVALGTAHFNKAK